MEFALTEEQLELQEMVREFVAKEITPYAAEMDRENHAREGLMEKVDRMVNRQLYTQSKTASTEEEREKSRQEYLDRRGIPDSFRW